MNFHKLLILIVGIPFLIIGLGGVLIPVAFQDGRTLHEALIHGTDGWIELVAMGSVCPLIILTSVICIGSALVPSNRPSRTN